MASLLPAETIRLILSFIQQDNQIPSLALVSQSWSGAVRLFLTQDVVVKSSTGARRLLRTLQANPTISPLIKSITLSREISQTEDGAKGEQKGKGKRKGNARGSKGKGTPVAGGTDEISPDDMVLLLGQLPHVSEVNLCEVGFGSLRRRHVNFTSTLPILTSLSISGRPESPFLLASVGRIISSCHQLKRLSLRHIQPHPSSFDGVPPPLFELDSFALFHVPNLEPEQLFWLLRSTAYAESLRTLALSWDDSPKILNSIRYVSLRVTKLALSTQTAGVVEAFVLHCPLLKTLEIYSTVAVEPLRMFENLEGPLLAFRDKSPIGGGVSLRVLAGIVQSRKLKLARDLRLIEAGSWAGKNEGAEELGRICEARKVVLKVGTAREAYQVGREGCWIPPELVTFHLIELGDVLTIHSCH